MASLDSLPADQRAVLQLVLQRGRSYDQIATLLSIDRGAVRARAVSAFDALGPQTGVSDQRRGLIADYLLGQLDPGGAEQTRNGIAASPSERAWARVVASELAPLASEPLPEIPSAPVQDLPPAPPEVAAPPPEPVPAGPEPSAEPSSTPFPAPAGEPAADDRSPDAAPQRRDRGSGRRSVLRRGGRSARGQATDEPEPLVPRSDVSERRSSRLGGGVLILVTVVIVAAVVVLLSSGGSNPPKPVANHTSSTAASSTAASGSASTTTSGSSTSAKVLAQINLTPPSSNSKAAGIAEVLREGAQDGIAIVAQNVPPNTTKPPNAYAVWLYNSPSDAHILGFVNPGVASNGRLSTAGGLPTNASHYKQLIVTLETKASPKTPGPIVLQGTLTGVS